MTAPASPRQVIADELDGAEDMRLAWAGGILAALAEHGYAVVSTAEPDDAAYSIRADGSGSVTCVSGLPTDPVKLDALLAATRAAVLAAARPT